MLGVKWAGRAANADNDALAMLLKVNQQSDDPLPHSEVQAIARSIDRYRCRWNDGGWHQRSWLTKQTARGRKDGIASGKARRSGSNEE